MSELKDFFNKRFRLILFAVVFVVIVFLIARNINAFGNVLLVLLGFGAVILVHEFGHFIVAKLSGIKVDAFSIGFPPILAGVRKTEDGYRIRILPSFFQKENDESGDGSLCFTVGKKGVASETEYCIGLIPFGGFVKMLGQEDAGQVKSTDDPRSYANKPVGIRAAVLAAGVVFNVISAVIIFMIVFLVGINLTPAVVGGVKPDSPAARVGLKAGDEIIEVAGKNDDLDFSNIGIAAALSGKDEKVPMTVRHEDGSEEDIELVAEQLPGEQMRGFGISLPMSLTVAELSKDGANDLYSKIGLQAGDRIKSVDGREVQSFWELEEVVQNTCRPSVKLSAERTKGPEKGKLVETEIALEWNFADSHEIESESELSHIYSMVPRLRVTVVSDEQLSSGDDSESLLQVGDIIFAIGDVENPTYKEMRDVTEEYEDKELPVKVLRINDHGLEEALAVTVTPKKPSGSDRVMIGIGVALDAEYPVVAKTIDAEAGPGKLAIPRGAAITAVDGAPVSNFYDVVREIRKYNGERITIDYRLNEEIAGNVVLNVETNEGFVTVKSAFTKTVFLPFAKLDRLYKAGGPIDAVAMGYKKTVMFVAQTYVTLRRLIGGLVSPRNLIGPIGIMTLSYRIVAEQPLVYYVYFIGLISATIAVFNFLPLPPLDGGLVVLLVVEKIKGSALSERAQCIAAYAGWVLIGTLILYVTFNDIIRSIFGYKL